MLVILCGVGGFAENNNYVMDSLKTGERLSTFAIRHNVNVNTFLSLNNLTDKKVQAGKLYKVKLKSETVNNDKKEDETSKQEEEKSEKVGSSNSSGGSPKGYIGRGQNRNYPKENTETIKDDSQKTKKNRKTSYWWLFWLLLGIGCGVFCWEKWLRKMIYPLSHKHEIKNEQLYIAELKKDRQELKDKLKEFLEKNKNLLYENNEIRKECSDKQKQIEKVYQKLRENQEIPRNVVNDIVQQTQVETWRTVSNTKTSNPSTFYADSIIEGVFNSIVEIPNEDTVFKIVKTSANKATFSIYPDAYKRIIKNPDFADGCDKQRINPMPKTLKIENGETSQDNFGKWQITKKAKIKFV